MHFICNALHATAFPTLREKKNPAAFLAHIYRRWLLAPFLLGFIHEGAVLCLSSCFCLPFSCQVGLYRCQSKNKTNPKGEKQKKNGDTPAEEKAANSHILKTCDGKYDCSTQFDHKQLYVCSFFPPRSQIAMVLLLDCLYAGSCLGYIHNLVCVCPHPCVGGRHAQFPSGGSSHKLLRNKCQLEGVVGVVSALRDGPTYAACCEIVK